MTWNLDKEKRLFKILQRQHETVQLFQAFLAQEGIALAKP
jgi:hypothetical protein